MEKIEAFDVIENWDLGYHLGTVIDCVRSYQESESVAKLVLARNVLTRYIDTVLDGPGPEGPREEPGASLSLGSTGLKIEIADRPPVKKHTRKQTCVVPGCEKYVRRKGGMCSRHYVEDMEGRLNGNHAAQDTGPLSRTAAPTPRDR